MRAVDVCTMHEALAALNDQLRDHPGGRTMLHCGHLFHGARSNNPGWQENNSYRPFVDRIITATSDMLPPAPGIRVGSASGEQRDGGSATGGVPDNG
jgi:hypothetical protein